MAGLAADRRTLSAANEQSASGRSDLDFFAMPSANLPCLLLARLIGHRMLLPAWWHYLILSTWNRFESFRPPPRKYSSDDGVRSEHTLMLSCLTFALLQGGSFQSHTACLPPTNAAASVPPLSQPTSCPQIHFPCPFAAHIPFYRS